jgi:hypothetical protein
MTKYGTVAVNAARLLTTGLVESPREAWSRAASDVFGPGTSGAQKGCPKDAFLGLCEKGLVKGVPAGRYTRSEKNKAYALDAVALLETKPGLATRPRALWAAVMGGESKAHNGQMDVVVALWNQGTLGHRAHRQ